MADFCVRPLTSVESLRRTRKSLGDGTADGRSRIAAPPAERPGRASGTGRRSGSNENAAAGDAAVPSDPRTLTLEAQGVLIPPYDPDVAPFRIPFQRSTSLLHQVRFDPPSLPATEVPIPSRAVWQPRVEMEWDLDEFGPDSTFLGGGEVRFELNGWTVWPIGEGSTLPGPGEARRYESVLPALELLEDDVVSVRIDQRSNVPRLAARVLVTLTLIEPFAGPVTDDDGPPSYDTVVATTGTQVCSDECSAITSGPQAWARWPGTDPVNNVSGGATCFREVTGSGQNVLPGGPFGDAAQHNEEGNVALSGSTNFPKCGMNRSWRTCAVWVNDNFEQTGLRWWVGQAFSAGAATVEYNGPLLGAMGSRTVHLRIGPRDDQRNFWTIRQLEPGWKFIVATLDEFDEFDEDGRRFGQARIWVNGRLELDDRFTYNNDANNMAVTTGNLRLWSGKNTLNVQDASRSNGLGYAEVMTWPITLSRTEVDRLNAAALRLLSGG